MWNVPPNACSAVTVWSRRRGNRCSIRLTLTCAPAPARRGFAEQCASTVGSRSRVCARRVRFFFFYFYFFYFFYFNYYFLYFFYLLF